MRALAEHDLVLVLASLATVLVVARALAEVARRLGQPEVVGEIAGGLVLGPLLAPRVPIVREALGNAAVADVLSAFAWLGAILLLLVAGAEVDLGILRAEARRGGLAAAAAIVPSIAAGAAFSRVVLGRPLAESVMLGLVFSVTAVSVAAKVLLERELGRRTFAQITLAAGVASEVVVWLLVAATTALRAPSPALAVARSTLAAALFFATTIAVGRRAVAWAMRRVADDARVARGPFTLVLVLACVGAALTAALGLHPLLGPFALGVLLAGAPRARRVLAEAVRPLATAVFAPLFFAIAGLRVDLALLATARGVGLSALLFAVATIAKIAPTLLAVRAAGLGGVESALVAVGLDMKGGTDLLVAIVGVELGLLGADVYTMYSVAALATVLAAPACLRALERRAPVQPAEAHRLAGDEARRRAYVPEVERVLVPVMPAAEPELAAELVRALAAVKKRVGEPFDVTELVIDGGAVRPAREALRALADEAAPTSGVELRERTAPPGAAVRAILDAARGHDLVAAGARSPRGRGGGSFGRLQDAIVRHAEGDVLIAVAPEDGAALATPPRRVLVPLVGLEYSLAASDIAAHLALGWDAELVVLHVVRAEPDALAWRALDRRRLHEASANVVEEAAFRARRLGVRTEGRVRVAERPDAAIDDELARGDVGLVVMGCYDHGAGARPHLGSTVELVLRRAHHTPAVLLVARGLPHARSAA
jgi:Kef-type K+ transport system membrane component KefB